MSSFARTLSKVENMIKRQGALKLLRTDHKLGGTLFEMYESACSSTKKQALIATNLHGADNRCPH